MMEWSRGSGSLNCISTSPMDFWGLDAILPFVDNWTFVWDDT